MTAFAINFISIFFIFIWASWCVVYSGVKDGIVGKMFFSLVAISALAVIIHTITGNYSQRPFISLNVSIALVGIRHVFLSWLKHFKAEHQRNH